MKIISTRKLLASSFLSKQNLPKNFLYFFVSPIMNSYPKSKKMFQLEERINEPKEQWINGGKQ